MFTLDYLRRMKDGRISLSPIHTGPLGLVPGTEVSISLMHERRDDAAACELSLTPYSEDVTNLFRLECYLAEDIGVVKKLIDAISTLRLNIVTFESSVLDYKTAHRVAMVVDWTHATYPTFHETPARIQRQYESVSNRIPTKDWRYILLYELIVCTCGDVLLFDESLNEPLPSISFIPIRPSKVLGPTRIEVESPLGDMSSVPEQKKTQKKKGALAQNMTSGFRSNFFNIPSGHLNEIHQETGHSVNEPLPYILSSSSSDQSLRVFFPSKTSTGQLVHIAFAHTNRPGALSTMMSTLAAAQLSIITGLVRKRTRNESTFEVLLENQDTSVKPPQRAGIDLLKESDAILEWCANRISSSANAVQLGRHAEFNTTLTMPRYPPRKSTKTYDISSLKPGATAVKDDEDQVSRFASKVIESHMSSIEDATNDKRPNRIRKAHLAHLEAVYDRIVDTRPRIFLSYPGYAKKHAELIKEAIRKSGRFDIKEYQDPDYENIVEEVQKRIRSSDFFIGVWHHEPTDTQRVSPWMPFEYGMATIAGLDCMITYSDQLPSEIWKRIDPNTAKVGYSDLSFSKDTVTKLAEKAFEKWAKGGHWPHLNQFPLE